MKKTPLYDKHVELGAKIVPFAGYEMPVSYSGIVDEHMAVRNSIGMFDVSHMGEFEIKGPRALDLLQHITSNDVAQLYPGRIQYSCMPNENGGIVDDLLVYCMGQDHYLLVVNASNIEKDWNWISRFNAEYGCSMTNISDNIALMAVQGPNAIKALQKLTPEQLDTIEYYHFRVNSFAGVPGVIISATGYTGAGGFEIYCPADQAAMIWDSIMEAGREFGIKPAGLGCRDTLRLEMGFCLYGNDIDDTTSPIEAGLGWITKFNKDFVNRAELERQKKEGASRKLVGLELGEKQIARQHFEICDNEGNTIGEVTSGTLSPSLNKPIAMGYVPAAYAKPGTTVKVKIRNKLADATVVKLPFYKNQ